MLGGAKGRSSGASYEVELPKDADMKPPGRLMPPWRPFLYFNIDKSCEERKKYGDHE
jgi:hypothetical protein